MQSPIESKTLPTDLQKESNILNDVRLYYYTLVRCSRQECGSVFGNTINFLWCYELYHKTESVANKPRKLDPFFGNLYAERRAHWGAEAEQDGDNVSPRANAAAQQEYKPQQQTYCQAHG